MFSVIVPVLHNFEGCTKMLSSVREPFVPMIVDNWNDNRGVAAAWNIGISRSLSLGIEKFIIINDDAYFEDDGLPSHLLDPLNDQKVITIPNDGIGFACFGMSATTVRKVGMFDEGFHPAYFEDNDYIYRVKLEGLDYVFTDTPVNHVGSRTQFWHGDGDSERIVSHERFRQNERYFKEKWGGPPREERYTEAFDGKQAQPEYHSPHYRRFE